MTRLAVDDASGDVPPSTYVPLTLGREKVMIDVDLNVYELRRREHRRSKPILSLDLLNLLLTMPLSSPIRADDLSDYDWRLLRTGSRIGAVDIARADGVSYATRRAAPPLDVRHVTVTANHWRRGLSVASRFAPYGSRELVLGHLPEDDFELRLKADYLGVGISLRGDSPEAPLHRVIEPAAFAPARYTGASWLFAERLIAQQTMLHD
jgi:hypothetical protein